MSVPDVPPSGRLLASLSLEGGFGYAHTESADGYTLRYFRTCEFRIDRDRREIRCHLAPSIDPAVASLLITGSVLAFILALAGVFTLHASAVEVGGAALAFVGGSGMGKSTLAALMCAHGARLVAEDLLRIERDGDRFRCHAGSHEIRLRSGAAGLADRIATGTVRRSEDGRSAIRVELRAAPMPILHAIVLPRPSRFCQKTAVRLLPPSEALCHLMSNARFLGWQSSEPFQRQFQAFAKIASLVPVYEAEIPWGPLFDAAIPSALRGAVGLDAGIVMDSG